MRSTIITEMFKNGGQLATNDMNKLMEVDTSLTWEEVIDLMVKKDILMFVGKGKVVKFHRVAIETASKSSGIKMQMMMQLFMGVAHDVIMY